MPPTRRKQRGGEYYIDINQVTQEEIIHIFCHGRTLEDLPSVSPPAQPLFILKWGPPGSGKSSKKVNSYISSLGIPKEDYMEYTPDVIMENILPFRFLSSMAKLEYEKIKALVEQKKYSEARELIQLYQLNTERKYSNKGKIQVKSFLNSWPTRSDPRLKGNSYHKSLNTILYNKTKSAYNFYREKALNDSGMSIRQKMRNVLAAAFTSNKNIQYESSGLGYGDVPEQQSFSNQYTSSRIRRSRGEQSVESVFKNTQETLLGRIVYDERTHVPIHVEVVNEYTVPLHYRILVIYPIIPREIIAERASLRASHIPTILKASSVRANVCMGSGISR